MKKIIIPESISVTSFDPETKEEKTTVVSFHDFVSNNFLINKAYGMSYQTLLESNKLEESLRKTHIGQPWELTDKQWERLNLIANYPDVPYSNVRLSRTLLPFFRAIHKAK